jgi:hypothetical protein
MSTKEDLWRSKLGKSYPKSFMEENEKKFFEELQSLRQEPENRDCADCHAKGCSMWASVNLGTFLCMTCGSHHRSLGTHISLPKGCTGTYLWGPDELENMKRMGNKRAKEVYGSTVPNGFTNTDAIRWKQYLTDKYVHRKYAASLTSDHPVSSLMLKKEPDLTHFDSSPKAVEGNFFANFRRSTNEEPHLRSLPSTHSNRINLLDVEGNQNKMGSSAAPDLRINNFFAEFGL